MTIEHNVRNLYEDLKSNIDLPRHLAKRLSAPLLIYPTKRWVEADKKVLVIGQETFGWGANSTRRGVFNSFLDFQAYEDSIDALLRNYEQFNFAFGTKYYGSPFWSAYRQIRRAVDDGDVDGIKTSVLWTNLFKVDFEEGSVLKAGTRQRYLIQSAFRGRLTTEIRILKPDALVFFTGPNYNFELESEFEGLSLKRFNEHDVSRSALLKHSSFGNALAIRTYHPRYLRTNRQWSVVDKIARQLGQVD